MSSIDHVIGYFIRTTAQTRSPNSQVLSLKLVSSMLLSLMILLFMAVMTLKGPRWLRSLDGLVNSPSYRYLSIV